MLKGKPYLFRLFFDLVSGVVVALALELLVVNIVIAIVVGVLFAGGLYLAGMPRGSHFDIAPVQEPRKNFYYRPDQPEDPGGTEYYRVWVLFDFRADFPLEIRNVELRYPPGKPSGGKQVHLDDTEQELTARRLSDTYQVDRRQSVEVAIVQEFTARYARSADHKETQIIFELNSRAWGGFRTLVIIGELAPIGELHINSKRVYDGRVQSLVTGIESRIQSLRAR